MSPLSRRSFRATHKEPVVTTDLSKFQQISGYKIEGILGMSFLRDFVVQIDFDKGSVTLCKELATTPGLDVVKIPIKIPQIESDFP